MVRNTSGYMSKGYTPEVPAVPAKSWVTCDGCGIESTPIDKDQIFWDLTPVGWASLQMKKEAAEYILLHFCADCIPTLTVRGAAIGAEAVDILGEDYFQ